MINSCFLYDKILKKIKLVTFPIIRGFKES